VAQGGNGIHVLWDSKEVNLHHVWDSSIAEKLLGGIRRKPYPAALEWSGNLTAEIQTGGKYAAQRESWTKGMMLEDPIQMSMGWATESNSFVCSTGKSMMMTET